MNRYWPSLILLAAIWGASYLFIKVAVDEIAPAPMMAVRTLLAAAVLIGYVVWRFGRERATAELRAAWRHCLVLGVLNAALPFWLIAWGEQHIDSGLAAVVQSSVPIFNALLVLRFLPHERLNRTRAFGLAIGILGVAVVAGIHPEGGGLAVAGALAIVVSSISYAGAGVYGQLAVSGTAGPVLAAGSMLAGGLILTPVALFQLPTEVPSLEATASVLALSLARDGGRPADPLPHARPARVVAPLARDVPDARLRARLRSAPARRADHTDDPGRPRPHPRRCRDRLREGPAPPRGGRRMNLRRAALADVDFLAELYADEDVRPWLAAGGRYDADGLRTQIERFDAEPGAAGLLVIELDGEPVGAMAWERVNERSRIAHLGGLAIHPAFRGRRLADEAARMLQRHLVRELGFHRLQLEVYGFNERAQRHAERSGFVREGVKRKAYLRDGEWVDGVLYGLIEDDLSEP